MPRSSAPVIYMGSTLLRKPYGLKLLQTSLLAGRYGRRAISSANWRFLAKSSLCFVNISTFPGGTWQSSDGGLLRNSHSYGAHSRVKSQSPDDWLRFTNNMPGSKSHRFHSCSIRKLSTNYMISHPIYFPLGNTSAAFLLQSLPPEQDANVLLLGCGDPRHILFTTYNVQDDESRSVDFTCCDLQPGVLARNILLLSLLLDDRDGSLSPKYWNIFYHFLIDNDSLFIIHTQAQKLVELSESIDAWHGSTYGQILRMSSQNTLSKLHHFWGKYAETRKPDQWQNLDIKFRDGWRKKAGRISEQNRITHTRAALGPRSTGPLSPISHSGIENYENFWETGVAGGNHIDLASAKNPNPIFLYTSAGDEFSVNEATDPVTGFHLEMAFTSVMEHGPFGKACEKSKSQARTRQQLIDHIVEVAKVQFKEWSEGFVKIAKRKKLIVRFHLGDALRFCRAVSIYRERGVDVSFEYTQAWEAAPLKLDGGDYEASSPFRAPMKFDVVDTSNVVDFVGLLNILMAASSVLSSKTSSVLYTETFAGSNVNQIAQLPHLVCGDVVTMSVLLGLAPVGYMTGTISGSSAQETLFSDLQNNRQFIRMSWKKPTLCDESGLESFRGLDEPRYKFDPGELAMVLFRIYRKMFEIESIADVKKHAGQPEEEKFPLSIGKYIRETYAEFLRLVQKRVDSDDWSNVMLDLYSRIVRYERSNLDVSVGYFNTLELFVHLYHLGISSMPLFMALPATARYQPGSLSKPMIATIVLTVPRSRLEFLINQKPGRVELYATIEPPNNLHHFSSIHTVFGRLVRSNDGLSATIVEDKDETANLIVSFKAPTYLLEKDPSISNVTLRLFPYDDSLDWKKLAPEGLIYESTLSSPDEVAIFPNPPGISCHRLVTGSQLPLLNVSVDSDARISNVAVYFDEEARVEKFKIRVDYSRDSTENKLLDDNKPSILQISPCALLLVIGDKTRKLVFPYPVDGSRSECFLRPTISGFFKITWGIEVSAPPSRPTDTAGFKPQILQTVNGEPPTVWDIPRVNLDRLPILDTESYENTNSWLPIHLSCMYSDAERKAGNQAEISNLKSNLKDSFALILLNATGSTTLGQKAQVFLLSSRTQARTKILIFIANIRLDLGSRTVVADARVLPLTERIISFETRALDALHNKGIIQMSLDDAELKCWEDILPTLVERCRSWKHTSSCEYRDHGIPASSKYGESSICSCGVGKAPPVSPEVEEWKPFEKHWTRAAIAPIFAAPYAESCSMAVKDLENFKSALVPSDDKKRQGIDAKTPKRAKMASRVSVNAPDVGKKARSVTGKAGSLESIIVCHACKQKPQGTALMVCKSCEKVYYCSVACERNDWKRHRRECKK